MLTGIQSALCRVQKLKKLSPSITGFVITIGLIGAATLGLSCSQPPVGSSGEAVEAGGIQFSVPGYELKRLEIAQDKGVLQYGREVLAIKLKVKNRGENAFMYTPTHNTQRMTESSTPLLYPVPESDTPLPVSSKNPIPGVYLQQGQFPGQVKQGQSLEPGDSLKDIYLFEVPDVDQSPLVFSIPPSLHRGKKPVFFRLSYEYEKPPAPQTYEKGEAADKNGVKFKVTDISVDYIEVNDVSRGKGYSQDPLVKISYRIENETDSKIPYRPPHGSLANSAAPKLSFDNEMIPRVLLPVTTNPKGQKESQVAVESGGAIEDYSLFGVPENRPQSVIFTYPASRFDRSGLIRTELSFPDEDPKKPEKLKEQLEDDEQ